MAATTKLLAALSLKGQAGKGQAGKGQAGGVHKDDAELGKQIAPAGEQLLFHDVLAAARCQLAGAGLIGERLTEPGHGAVQMM